MNKNILDTEAWCCTFAVYMLHKVLVYLKSQQDLGFSTIQAVNFVPLLVINKFS